MENYIMFEGKKIPLTDEQITALKIDNGTERSPFERQDEKGVYYYIDLLGNIMKNQDSYSKLNDAIFDVANYCTDEELMRQRALHEILNRLLWRRSMQDGEGKRPWDLHTNHYSIGYDCQRECLRIYASRYTKDLMLPHFPSRESAEHALSEIVEPFMEKHPDFVW